MTDYATAALDLYHGNPEPTDWTTLATAVPGLIHKAIQDDYVDPAFIARIATARSAGMMTAAYCFLTGDRSGADQADAFLAAASGAGVSWLALDLERNVTAGQTTATITIAEDAVQRIEQMTGKLPLIYVGRYFPGLPSAILSDCPLWLPEYGDDPVAPAGWTGPALWQHTDKGFLAGMGGPGDISLYDGSVDELRAAWAAGFQ